MTTSYDESVIKVVCFNLEHDGGAPDESGRFPARWHQAHDFLRELRPDILLRQELTYSRADGHHRLHAAETALRMRGFIGCAGDGRNPTGLFVNTAVFDVHRQFDHPRTWRTPPTNVIGRLPEVPGRDIILLSWHAASPSPRAREREADEISAFADKMKTGSSFIGGGDCNEYPHPKGETVPPIDWSSPDITDLPHKVHRSNRGPDGSRVSCTYLDKTLLACGLHDPARRIGTPEALLPTAGHAPQSRNQGGGRRIDRVYNDPWTVTAVTDVIVHDVPFSDHKAVEVVYDRRRFVEAQRRAVEPLAPYDLSSH